MDEMHPKKGDAVVHCSHAPRTTDCHWWRASIHFIRPDGTAGDAKWIVACDSCFVKSEGDPERVEVDGDGEIFDISDDATPVWSIRTADQMN